MLTCDLRFSFREIGGRSVAPKLPPSRRPSSAFAPGGLQSLFAPTISLSALRPPLRAEVSAFAPPGRHADESRHESGNDQAGRERAREGRWQNGGT